MDFGKDLGSGSFMALVFILLLVSILFGKARTKLCLQLLQLADPFILRKNERLSWVGTIAPTYSSSLVTLRPIPEISRTVLIVDNV